MLFQSSPHGKLRPTEERAGAADRPPPAATAPVFCGRGDAHADADALARQVEIVTTRVLALVGVHAVLHHEAIAPTPSMLAICEVGPLPQQ